MTILSINHFLDGFVNMFVLKSEIPCCLPASFQCEGQETVVVHLAAALWRLTNGAGTFGAWKIGA